MTDFILDLIARGGYWGIAFLMALENIFPPIPSEVIMGLGGMAVARGDMALVPLILAGTAGTTVGNLFWYWIGRKFGYERFKPVIDRFGRWMTLEWEDVEQLHAIFIKYGSGLVFFFRFLPTFRTLISLPAGMVRMNFWKFVAWTFAGSAIWNLILAYTGIWFGNNFEELDKYVGPVVIGVMALVVVLYVYRLFTWKPRAKR